MSGSQGALRAIGIVAASVVCIAVAAPGASADSPLCYGQTPTITGSGTISGTPGNDIIEGSAGNDTINGGGGADTICGEDGADTITTGAGTDTVAGQGGNDHLQTGGAADFIDGGQGKDTCNAGGQAGDVVTGCTNPTQYLVGQQAPDFTARTAFDNKFKLSDLQGQNVLIDFSSIWCGPSSSMATDLAGVQQRLRAAGVKFTYVLAEIQGATPGVASTRRDAESMTERWGLYNSPVLSADADPYGPLGLEFLNYSSENFPFDENGNNQAFPTLVFINPKGKVTDIHLGSLTGQEIEDRYKSGLQAPPQFTQVSPPLPGRDIEDLEGQVSALSISGKARKHLNGILALTLRSLEARLKPKTSPCDLLDQFAHAVAKTKGLSGAQRSSLNASAHGIAVKVGCTSKAR